MKNISKEERRARVSQLIKEGRVMNDSTRRRNKKEAERIAKLEAMAESVLVGMNGSSNRSVMGSSEPVVKEKAPEANVFLKNKVKQDKLATAAAQIIKELQNV
jgi:hypothetical protein